MAPHKAGLVESRLPHLQLSRRPRRTPMILVVPRGSPHAPTIVPTDRILRVARETLGDPNVTLEDVSVRFVWDHEVRNTAETQVESVCQQQQHQRQQQHHFHAVERRDGSSPAPSNHRRSNSTSNHTVENQPDSAAQLRTDFPSKVHIRNLALTVTPADLADLVPPHIDLTHLSTYPSKPPIANSARHTPSLCADLHFSAIHHVYGFLHHLRHLYATDQLVHLQVDADHALSAICPGYDYYYALYAADLRLPSPEDLSFQSLNHVFVGNLVEETTDQAIFELMEHVGVKAHKVFARPPRARAFGLPKYRGARYHFKSREEAVEFGRRLVEMSSEGGTWGMGVEWVGELVVRY